MKKILCLTFALWFAVLIACRSGGGVYPTGSLSDAASAAVTSRKPETAPPAESGTVSSETRSAPSKTAVGADSRQNGSSSEEAGTSSAPAVPSENDAASAADPPKTSSEPPAESKPFCTFSISCATVFDNLNALAPGIIDLLPEGGMIVPPFRAEFEEGESVFDVLKRVCDERGIRLEFSFTAIYGSYYIEGINDLYEFDCGQLSGWMYRVDGWFPNFGCSSYRLKSGQTVEWLYTCDLGADVGGKSALG